MDNGALVLCWMHARDPLTYLVILASMPGQYADDQVLCGIFNSNMFFIEVAEMSIV